MAFIVLFDLQPDQLPSTAAFIHKFETARHGNSGKKLTSSEAAAVAIIRSEVFTRLPPDPHNGAPAAAQEPIGASQVGEPN